MRRPAAGGVHAAEAAGSPPSSWPSLGHNRFVRSGAVRVIVEMPTKEDWEIVGLGPVASPADVQSAWRRLSRQTNPDVGGTDALFRRVMAAYGHVLAELEYRDRIGAPEDVSKPPAGAETPRPHEAEDQPPAPTDPEGGQARRRAVRFEGMPGWLSLVPRPAACIGAAVLALLYCAALLCWRPLKVAGRIVRFVALAGSWPTSLRGVVSMLVLAFGVAWLIADCLHGPFGTVQDVPLAVAFLRFVCTPFRRRR